MNANLLTLILSILHTCSFLCAQDNLELYLPFNGHLEDQSQNQYNTSSQFALEFLQDGCGQAVKINDNNTDVIFVDGNVFNGLQDFTISVLIKLDGLNSSNNLISCANNTQANDFIMGYNSYPDTYVDSWHMIIDGVRYPFDSNDIVNDLDWHHITMVRVGNMGKLFIDGHLIGKPIYVSSKALNVVKTGFVIGQDQDCIGGCFEFNQSWFGQIDELKIFSKALEDKDTKNLSCLDCAGKPNGKAIIDTCGVCLESIHPDFNQSCVVDFSIYIPSSFSPNEDGVNDLFRVFASEGVVRKILRYEIYGSTGDMIFKKDNMGIHSNVGWWNGRFRGERVIPGVFKYKIEVLFFNDEIRTYEGDVTLIR